PRNPPPTTIPTPRPTPVPGSEDDYEPDNTCAQAKHILADGIVQHHTFHEQADVDWIRFDAVAGTTYLIEARIPPGASTDIILEIYAHCEALPTTVDPTFAPGVRLEFESPATGPLFLRLNNARVAAAESAYTLSVRTLSNEPDKGVLILVAGRLKSPDQVQPNIHHVTTSVYQLFQRKGYDDDHIRYLATDRTLPGITADDPQPTRDNLKKAITTWARERICPGLPLTLYLMDHGSRSHGFYLDEPNQQRVSPADLDAWLDELESACPEVTVNVIIEACYAGTFIREVSQPGRVVIASTSDAWSAYASRHGAFFSDQLIVALGQGSSLYAAFQEGASAVRQAGYRSQTPWLDDNGNGIPNEAGDGQEAQHRGFTFAGSFDEEWPPYIEQVESPVTVEMEERRGDIRARVLDNGQVDDVWAVVYDPTYQPPAPGDELVEESLPTIKLLPQSEGWYSAAYTGFNQAGTYRIVVHAVDDAKVEALPVEVAVVVPAEGGDSSTPTPTSTPKPTSTPNPPPNGGEAGEVVYLPLVRR
ncbi:MAG: hypothetical protein HC884_19560, partial [Chloroflexaceae bacterium]|nr:hypothetical protein [Chloroflexaceae bacterium]